MKLYAGVGSRETPEEALHLMKGLATTLCFHGWTLRSGGAVGADTAFENGAGLQKQIFTADDCTQEALEFSSRFHPAWSHLTPFARKLHGRNAQIIMGQGLEEPVDFVVCWTPRGIVTGGTGQAMRIASHLGIPIVNLALDRDKERFLARWGIMLD